MCSTKYAWFDVFCFSLQKRDENFTIWIRARVHPAFIQNFFLFWPFVRWSHAWQYGTGPSSKLWSRGNFPTKEFWNWNPWERGGTTFLIFFSLPSFPPRRMHLKKRIRVITTTRVVSKLQCTQHLRTTGCMHYETAHFCAKMSMSPALSYTYLHACFTKIMDRLILFAFVYQALCGTL